MTLTKRQREILSYIEETIATSGYAPTLEEIGERFELSSMATVHKHVTNLEKKGAIRRKWNRSRSIELVEQEPKAAALELRLLGKVAAGQPIEAIEGNDTIDVPAGFVPSHGSSYVLEVTGQSMRDEGILDGDYIVVQERQSADNGDMVVASLNGDATVKRFYRENDGSVRLQPANDEFDPIIVGPEDGDFQIKGKVVAVLRRYH